MNQPVTPSRDSREALLDAVRAYGDARADVAYGRATRKAIDLAWNRMLAAARIPPLGLRAALADEQRDTLDAAAIADALRAMDGANLRAEDDGYFNMAWREWSCSDIAAALAARLKGEKP